MTKKLLRAIIFVVLAGFIFWAGDVFAGGGGTVTGQDAQGNTVTVQYSNYQTFMLDAKGCTPLSAKLEMSRNCFFCPLFKILFTAAASVSVASFDTLAEPFKKLLALGLALYIAFLTLRQVSAFTKQDGSKYISEILTMSFKVLIVWLLLSNGSQIYKLALEPILSAGIEVGTNFLSSASSDNGDLASCSSGALPGTDRAFYSDALEQKIDCFLKKVAEETALAHTIGSAMWCASTLHTVFPKFATAIGGGLVIVLAWLISIAFAFYLIDSVIRLGIIGALLPFLLAAWPFKVTSGYTAKGWNMFLNAFFVFVFLGLIIAVVVQLLASAATNGGSDLETIQNYMATDNIEELAKTVQIGGAGFIFLALCGLFGFKLCKEASSMAAEMGTSGGTAIGSKIGGLAMNTAQTAGKKAFHGAVGAGRMAAQVIPMGNGESLASKAHKKADKWSGGLHKFTRKFTNFLSPQGRIENGSGGDDQGPSFLNDNQSPNSPIGGGNNKPQPNNNADNNFEDTAPNTNPVDNDTGGAPTGGVLTNNSRAGGNSEGYDNLSLDNGLPEGSAPAIPLGSGKQESQAPTGNEENSPAGGDSSGNYSASATADAELARAENATENREPTGKGNGESQTGKQNLDEEARRAAESAVNRVMGQNKDNAPQSGEANSQNSSMKEGKVYTQNGKLQSETTRGADGNLVKTNYDKDGNISSIMSEDKNGNREWSKYDTQGNVVESGNMKMATENGKSYVASQQIVKNGVSTTQNFYANGKILSESVQSVAKDGKPADLISFRQYNEQGQLIASENGKPTPQKAETAQTSTTKGSDGAQAAEKQQQTANDQKTDSKRLQDSEMKEGKVFDKNGKLLSETIRDDKGHLVKTSYDEFNGKKSSVMIEDKDGNRKWTTFHLDGVTINRKGSRQMAYSDGKAYVKEEREKIYHVGFPEDNSENIKKFNSSGKIVSEGIYHGDGSFQQKTFDESGKLQSSRSFVAFFGQEAVVQYKNGKIVATTITNLPENTITRRGSSYNDTGASETKKMTEEERKAAYDRISATQKQHNIAPQNTSTAQGQPEQPKTQTAQPNTQTEGKQAQPNTQAKGQQRQTQAKKPIERLQEGVVRDEEGRMRSETVKHDNGKSTRVLYNENGKIYDVAEEDEKGNRQWQSFDENGKPTEHGTRTINEDGSATYKIYDNNNKLISETRENVDGTVSQTIYNNDGEAYLRIGQDKDGNVSYRGIDDKQAGKDESLKPEESSNMNQPRKLDAVDILQDMLFKNDQKDKTPNLSKNDEKEAELVRVKLLLSETEALLDKVKKTADGLKNVGGAAASLSNVSLGALKQELQRRGVKI